MMEKILVVGSPGAGKSTFARGLHEKTRLPLYYLDMLWHLPDHTTIPEDEFDRRLLDILLQPRWIIDGNYSRTLAWRLMYAQTIFWLDFPLEVCLEGIRGRIGTKREDMPWETETHLDPEFEQYVRDFPEKRRPLLENLLSAAAAAEKQVVVFSSRDEAHAYLDRMSVPIRNTDHAPAKAEGPETPGAVRAGRQEKKV